VLLRRAHEGRTLLQQRFEDAALRKGTLAGRGETALGREHLGLGFVAPELALGQRHCSSRDPLSSRHGAFVLGAVRRGLQRAARLLEGTFYVLCTVTCLEAPESLLELRRMGSKRRVLRKTRSLRSKHREPEGDGTPEVCPSTFIDT
jgi:hypothetical protein